MPTHGREGNVIFVLENLAEPQHSTAWASTEEPAMPATEAQRHYLDVGWQTRALEPGQKVRYWWKFHRPELLNFVAPIAVRHRGFDLDQLRWQVQTSQDGQFNPPERWDEEGLVIRSGMEVFDWEDDNAWFGGPGPRDIESLEAASRLHGYTYRPEVETPVTWARVVFTIPEEAEPNAYLRIPYWFIGSALQPEKNFRWGADVSYQGLGTTSRTFAGSVQQDTARPVLRSHNMEISGLSDADAFWRLARQWFEAGENKRVLVLPYPLKRQLFYQYPFLVTATRLPRVQTLGAFDAHNDRNTIAFAITETF